MTRGKLVARYDKIHLFGFEMGKESYSEQRTIEPGKARSRSSIRHSAASGCRSATTCVSRSCTAP